MDILEPIKTKFILNLVAASVAILISVIVAYFIAVSSIKTIMTDDINTVATIQQEKLVAFRYIGVCGMWIIPGVNKADYFDEISSAFLKSFAVLGINSITLDHELS